MRYLQQLSVLEQQAATEGRYVLQCFTSTQVETRLTITHFHGTMFSHLLEYFKYLVNDRVRNSVFLCLSASDEIFAFCHLLDALWSYHCLVIVQERNLYWTFVLNMLIAASFKFISPYKVRNEVEKEEGKEKNYSIDGYF